jgi:hypothetical protein
VLCIFGAFWWLFQPLRWEKAFSSWAGDLWWIWPIIGIIFLPWTTIMYVIVAPGGLVSWDWLWLGIMLFFDVAPYTGGFGHQRVPGYQGY